MRRWLPAGLGFVAAALGLLSRPGSGAASASGMEPQRALAPAVELETLATQLTSITATTNAGDGRLFLTLQRGLIVVWDGTQVLSTPFLDVSSLIVCCGERGLLSTAFHPQYAQNGFFFVNYTNSVGATVVARYRVSSGNPNVADPQSAAILLTIDQPFANHNGGQLQFGPDGFLYIGMGDGGSANDPFCNAQRNDTLLGKLLRIDVDQNVDQPPFYGIPAGNPFVATGGPAEAWAKGLRNPWRFSFDRLTDDLFIGDVGQGQREEIDHQPWTSGGGEDYGWKIMEGTLCGDGGNGGCPTGVPGCGDPSYTLPIIEYGHGGGRCTVIGGYVYRGLSIPDLYGNYLYGDYCSGEIWTASPQLGTWSSVLLPVEAPSLTTFGEDFWGEIYVGTETGTLYRMRSSIPLPPVIGAVAPASGLTRGYETVTITGANFTGQTQVAFGPNLATVTVINPTTLTAVTPPHPPGTVDVIVGNPGAPPATKAGAFAYFAIPRATPRPGTRVVER
ncbi:MAG TPA: PQQ-dependent sugar dehydrogenase [Thermoanaerobaculia bacterium]|jgi:glucose/arabinose dehydrogenase